MAILKPQNRLKVLSTVFLDQKVDQKIISKKESKS